MNQIFIDTYCDKYRELFQPKARRNRSHSDLRRSQWNRTTVHADFCQRCGTCWFVPSSGRDCCRVHISRWSIRHVSRHSTLVTRPSAALSDDDGDGGESRQRGIDWGTYAGRAVVARNRWLHDESPAVQRWHSGWTMASDAACLRSNECKVLAFTEMFVLDSNTQFRLGPLRGLTSTTYRRFQHSKGAGSIQDRLAHA